MRCRCFVDFSGGSTILYLGFLWKIQSRLWRKERALLAFLRSGLVMKPRQSQQRSAERIRGYWLCVLFLISETRIRVGMFFLKCGVCWDNMSFINTCVTELRINICVVIRRRSFYRLFSFNLVSSGPYCKLRTAVFPPVFISIK